MTSTTNHSDNHKLAWLKKGPNVSLKYRLVVIFFALGIFPLIFIAGLLLYFFTDSMQEQAIKQLISVRNIKKAQVVEYITTLKKQTQYFVGNAAWFELSDPFNTPILKYLTDFNLATAQLSNDPKIAFSRLGELYVPGSEDQSSGKVVLNREYYDYTHEDIHPHLKSFIDEFGFEDFLLVNADGYVIYSVKKNSNIGESLVEGKHANSGLSKAFQLTRDFGLIAFDDSKQVKASSNFDPVAPFFFTDFEYDSTTKKLAAFISIPLFGSRAYQGAVIYQVPISLINKIMAERAGLGETGETYLIGQDHRLRSTIYRMSESRTHIDLLDVDIRTEPAIAALKGDVGHQKSVSYMGDEVLSAYTPINLFGLRWALIAEVTTAEAYAMVYRLAVLSGLAASVALLVIVGICLFIANSISRPVVALTRASEKIAGGDLEQNIDINRTDELGRLANSFSSMRDAIAEKLSEIERQNKELIKVDQLKDDLLANTSHELRTPLNGIIGLSESMIGSVPDHFEKTLHNIIASGRRLSNLVNDILDSAQLKHKSIVLDIQEHNLRQIVDFNHSISSALIGSKPLKLVNAVPDDIAVLADQNRLLQILQNLVGNAIKFSSSGEVVVSARKIKKNVEISVSDNGPGIAEENLERIFLSFEQGDLPSVSHVAGSGLGLSITKQLIKLHSGSIRVESEIGKGTIFTFLLPGHIQVGAFSPSLQSYELVSKTVGEPLRLNASMSNIEDRGHRFSILAVDDEPINLQVIANHLSALEYCDVKYVSSGYEALSVVEQQKVDLILLDVMMPQLGGYEVCQRVRENYSMFDLPIIFLTAHNKTSELIKAFSVGANDYLSKPFCKEELMARISVQLDCQINRERMHKLRVLANTMCQFGSHEEMLREAYTLFKSDSIVEDAAVYFGGDLLLGNESDLLIYPSEAWSENELLVSASENIVMYCRVSSFYVIAVLFPQFSSEEWVRNICLQIEKSAANIRKISANPNNSIITTEVVPYLSQILYVKVENQYCVIVRENKGGLKETLLRIPFKKILLHIQKECLLQVHRSYAVNPEKIVSIESRQQLVKLQFNQTVPVAKKYVKELKEQYGCIQTKTQVEEEHV